VARGLAVRQVLLQPLRIFPYGNLPDIFSGVQVGRAGQRAAYPTILCASLCSSVYLRVTPFLRRSSSARFLAHYP